jgi:hypothetical protein
MKQIAQVTLALIALVAVSACSATSSNDVYSDYDYSAVDTSTQTVLVTDLMN